MSDRGGGHDWTVADAVAIQALNALGGRFLPWSAGAMRPSGLLAVLNEVVLGGRKRVLECGAGISTVYLARLLAQRRGRLVSLEHDRSWARFVEGELSAERLDKRARVVLAPLEPHPLSMGGAAWYASDPVASAVDELDEIDLLLVDGPPADRPEVELSRYPALPVLGDALAPQAVVVLDDANRRGEAEVLQRWREQAGIEFELRPDLGWIAVGRR